MKINLENKTTVELKQLLDNVKVSDLSFDEKRTLVEEIECKINGSRYSRIEVLKEIEAGMADLDDVGV